MPPQIKQAKLEKKILRHCSRCGDEWCELGRVVKFGKRYPAYTVKKADGTKEERPADTEIKEALCKPCAKDVYDLELPLQAKLETLEAIIKEVEGMREKCYEARISFQKPGLV